MPRRTGMSAILIIQQNVEYVGKLQHIGSYMSTQSRMYAPTPVSEQLLRFFFQYGHKIPTT